ncbi:tetratricopeptide repeat protein [Candidatus Peregrinibacteria bacterium]|nr:tetratricopeptide repeat protein [Candidatus Peregrinibacteria bacterium]
MNALTRNIGIVMLFFAVTIAVYATAVRGNFFVEWDDYKLIVENPILQEVSVRNIRTAFTAYDPELYIPLTFMSYHADRILGGGWNPSVTHGINLILHTLNALLVTWILSVLTGNRKASVIAGLLFAVHPLHTEAVMWASARKDVLSIFFFLLSWSSYLQFRRDDARPLRWYATAVFLLFLALLSKVVVVTLPIVLLMTDYLQRRRIDFSNIREKSPFFLLSFVFGVIALFGQRSGSSLYYEKFLIGCKAIFLYLGKLVVPMKFSILYPFTESISISNPGILFSVLGVILISILVFLFRNHRSLPFAWMFFTVTVLPTMSNFTKSDYYFHDVYVGSDRYAYIASIGVFFLLAGLISKVQGRLNAALYSVSALILAVFGYLSYQQSFLWKDTGVLFVNVIRHYPNSHLAHNNVGAILEKQGKYDLAVGQYRESLAIRPNERAYYNLAQLYVKAGRTEEARGMYLLTLEQNPGHTDAKVNLAALLIRSGSYDEAIVYLQKALEEEPKHEEAMFNLARAYELSGSRENALGWYRSLLQLTLEDQEIREKINALLR